MRYLEFEWRPESHLLVDNFIWSRHARHFDYEDMPYNKTSRVDFDHPHVCSFTPKPNLPICPCKHHWKSTFTVWSHSSSFVLKRNKVIPVQKRIRSFLAVIRSLHLWYYISVLISVIFFTWKGSFEKFLFKTKDHFNYLARKSMSKCIVYAVLGAKFQSRNSWLQHLNQSSFVFSWGSGTVIAFVWFKQVPVEYLNCAK